MSECVRTRARLSVRLSLRWGKHEGGEKPVALSLIIQDVC